MSGASEHITLRIPTAVIEALRKEALELERSVSWVIVKKLARTVNAAVPLASTPLEAQKTKVGDGGASKTPGHHPRCKCTICAPPVQRA